MKNQTERNMISFIIPVLNGEKYIGQCLNHIFREMDDNDEIIVVDNGSTDDTLIIVKQYKKIKVLIFPEITIAALRNRGADIAKGDILAFIDSDCLVCEGWREAVESVLSDQTVKATGSFYNIPVSTTWVERAWWSFSFGKTTNTKTKFIISGNFIIRKVAFNEIFGFNEKLITDEDTEICSRLNELGYCMIEAPQIRVIHLGNAKTLREFIKKKKWHSTSILETMTIRKVDKPMIMTLVFMICCLFAVLSILFSLFCHLNLFVILLSILITPIATALYRIYKYKNYRYFFQLIILYFLFYLVRSITLTEFLFKRCLNR